MRPFEIGDIVIVPKLGSRNLKTIDRIVYEPEMGKSAEENITLRLKPYGQCKSCDVKTIREPRHGSKEARDIVAMLGREYHNELLKLWRFVKDDKVRLLKYWENRYFNRLATKYNHSFQKAKSMLQVKS